MSADPQLPSEIARPAWQRHLPVGAAATVLVAAAIGLIATPSSGTTDRMGGPPGGPPGMPGPMGPAPGQAPPGVR